MEVTAKEKSKRTSSPRRLYNRPGGLIITISVIILGAFLAGAFLLPKGERIDRSGYQVVYVQSGQVYFGKLQSTDGAYMVLKHAFTTQAQSGGQDNLPAQTSIIKVSEQVYGPTDTISLKSDQVVFWQNLRSDSKVVTAINNGK